MPSLFEPGLVMARSWNVRGRYDVAWHGIVRHGGYGPFVTDVTTLCGIELPDALVDIRTNFVGSQRVCKRCERKAEQS